MNHICKLQKTRAYAATCYLVRRRMLSVLWSSHKAGVRLIDAPLHRCAIPDSQDSTTSHSISAERAPHNKDMLLYYSSVLLDMPSSTLNQELVNQDASIFHGHKSTLLSTKGTISFDTVRYWVNTFI